MDGSVAGAFLPGRTTKLSRPVIGWRVAVGFPSPAEDYVEGRIDLSRDLAKSKQCLIALSVVAGMIKLLWATRV